MAEWHTRNAKDVVPVKTGCEFESHLGHFTLSSNCVIIFMECEYCGINHSGNFGSGRFCSSFCSRGFSTKNKRLIINEKIKQTFKEKNIDPSEHLHNPIVRQKRNQTMMERYGTIGFTNTAIKKRSDLIKQSSRIARSSVPFEELSIKRKKKFLIDENGWKCEWCKNSIWLDNPIPLEIDHIDGNHKNNSKNNFRLLCPNCHALTPTYKSKNQFKNKN